MSRTQAEADYLMQLEKKFTNDDPLILGPGPLRCVRTLISGDRREQFLPDVHRGSLLLQYHDDLTFTRRIIAGASNSSRTPSS